jgi:hypothetical protein
MHALGGEFLLKILRMHGTTNLKTALVIILAIVLVYTMQWPLLCKLSFGSLNHLHADSASMQRFLYANHNL